MITSKLADAVLAGKQLKENKANTTAKIEEIKPEDAGVEAKEEAVEEVK